MKKLQKHRLLLIHIAALVLILGLAVEFAEEIQEVKKSVYHAIRSERLLMRRMTRLRCIPLRTTEMSGFWNIL